jgi:uncharacterized surface protein with fasciclin (FAS1) repeats
MGSQSFAAGPTQDIVDTAVAAGQFNTLVSAVKIAGLVDFLKSPNTLTVFAPTDAAFAKVPSADLAALLADPVKLRALILHHIYKNGEVSISNIQNNLTTGFSGTASYDQEYFYLQMASGRLKFGCPENESFFNELAGQCNKPVPLSNGVEVNYVATDIQTTNGIIQAVDTVLF